MHRKYQNDIRAYKNVCICMYVIVVYPNKLKPIPNQPKQEENA